MVATHQSLAQLGSPVSRRRAPELEADYNRNPSLGYEPTDEVGFIRCLDHGYPTPLARGANCLHLPGPGHGPGRGTRHLRVCRPGGRVCRRPRVVGAIGVTPTVG